MEPFLDENRRMAWYITIFGPNIAEECYKFYAHMVGLTIRISEPETCSLHVATPLLQMPILLEAIKKVQSISKPCLEACITTMKSS
jgi:hypothetical protein